MATFNIHAGHGVAGGKGCGATGLLDESTEARKVKDILVGMLRQSGHTVYDCTYNGSAEQNTILSAIVKKCNAHKVDLDVSIHLNSGRKDTVGDSSTGGVEVYGYNNGTRSTGEAICSNVARSLNIRNRGFKVNTNLYVLSNTNAPALLIECCFVDDKDDVDRWNTSKCAAAIFQAITGCAPTQMPISTNTTDSSKPTAKSDIVVTYAVKANGKVLPFVTNLNDYAGIVGAAITALAVKVNKGSIKYRVHEKAGTWSRWITGCDWNDHKNGYAGSDKEIDAVQVYYYTPSDIAKTSGYKKAKYRVSTLGTKYLAWQYDTTKALTMDGYAGVLGKAIDRLQITIE